MKNEKRSDATELDLLEVEWNFDRVPDSELAACCLWEYARESVSFGYSSAHRALERREEEERKMPVRLPDLEHDAFIEAFRNSDEGYTEFYELMLDSGGPAMKPWQELTPEAREDLRGKVGHTVYGGPLQLAYCGQLEKLWNSISARWAEYRQQPGYDAGEDSIAYEPVEPVLDEPGHAGEPHGPTIAVFSIDLRKYSDKQICAEFASWLRTNRPGSRPEPSDRGRKLRDVRVALERLAMMRLLHHFTLKEMPIRCPAAWRIYGNREWYKERKRAGKMFRRLFPFLADAEEPLSWFTKGGRSKWVGNQHPFGYQ